MGLYTSFAYFIEENHTLPCKSNKILLRELQFGGR